MPNEDKLKINKPKPQAKKTQPFFPPAKTPKKESASMPVKDFTSALSVMGDDNYIDNHISEVEYWYGDVAVIRYENGSTLRLGITSAYLEAPIEAVNFRTLADEYEFAGDPAASKNIPYRLPGDMPEITEANKSKPFVEIMNEGAEQISFHKHTKSGIIVPNIVNEISAPNLCLILRSLEAEYMQNFDLTLEMMEAFVLIFSMYYGSISVAGAMQAGEAKAAEEIAKKRAKRELTKEALAELVAADQVIFSKFQELYASGAAGHLIVDAVEFKGIYVFKEADDLIVRYGGIENLYRIPDQGKKMIRAFENNIKYLAENLGIKGSKVQIYTIINSDFKNWLIQNGYVIEHYDVVINGIRSYAQVLEKVIY